MRSTVAILLTVSLLGCSSLRQPPSATVVKVPVPVPCQVPEPACSVPAYDGAELGMQVDEKVVRAVIELREREQCLAEYRAALAACRDPGDPVAGSKGK